MNLLVDLIYNFSTMMLVPVMLALLVLFAWSFMEIGGLLREWQGRWRARAHRQELLRLERRSEILRNLAAKAPHLTGLLGKFARDATAKSREPNYLDRILADLEIDSAGRLARMSFGIRIGPLLGLMGTLVPLGPALIGLADGDIQTMATNLVVAFGTTVLGVFVGGVCYGMLLLRRQWYARDLADIEHLCRLLSKESASEQDVAPQSAHDPQEECYA